jgi:hypothetical protein
LGAPERGRAPARQQEVGPQTYASRTGRSGRLGRSACRSLHNASAASVRRSPVEARRSERAGSLWHRKSSHRASAPQTNATRNAGKSGYFRRPWCRTVRKTRWSPRRPLTLNWCYYRIRNPYSIKKGRFSSRSSTSRAPPSSPAPERGGESGVLAVGRDPDGAAGDRLTGSWMISPQGLGFRRTRRREPIRSRRHSIGPVLASCYRTA